jgi:hypothetical protein
MESASEKSPSGSRTITIHHHHSSSRVCTQDSRRILPIAFLASDSRVSQSGRGLAQLRGLFMHRKGPGEHRPLIRRQSNITRASSMASTGCLTPSSAHLQLQSCRGAVGGFVAAGLPCAAHAAACFAWADL